jgi:hypothetical protein
VLVAKGDDGAYKEFRSDIRLPPEIVSKFDISL